MDAVKFNSISAPDLAAIANKGDRSAGFANLVRDGMQRLSDFEAHADEQVRKLLSGEPVELHRVVMAGEQAGLAFELMMSIRNKAVEAYQEVMRMQV